MLLMEVRLIYWFETFRTSVNFSLLGTVCTSLHSNTLLGSWNDLEHSEKPQDVFRSFKSLSYHKHSRIIVRLNYGVNYQDNCKACNCMGWIIICNGNPSDHANDFVHFKHRIIKRQNGKQYKGKPNRVQSALARRMRQGCSGPPTPPHSSPA